MKPIRMILFSAVLLLAACAKPKPSGGPYLQFRPAEFSVSALAADTNATRQLVALTDVRADISINPPIGWETNLVSPGKLATFYDSQYWGYDINSKWVFYWYRVFLWLPK